MDVWYQNITKADAKKTKGWLESVCQRYVSYCSQEDRQVTSVFVEPLLSGIWRVHDDDGYAYTPDDTLGAWGKLWSALDEAFDLAYLTEERSAAGQHQAGGFSGL
eukprot:2007024-Amphidinium_carterae.2